MSDAEQFSAVAHAWHEYIGLSERESICALAYVPLETAKLKWPSIAQEYRAKIVLAFRRAVELGAICGWALISEAERQKAGT